MPFKSSASYKILYPEAKVRFTKSGKYGYDFKKGDLGEIERVISPFPSATDTIYLVRHHKTNSVMWATGADVETFEQLSLIENKPAERCLNVFCPGVRCRKDSGHQGNHFDSHNGIEWNYRGGRATVVT